MSSKCCDTNEESATEKKSINWRASATVISGIGTVAGFLLSYAGISGSITNIIFLISIIVGGIFVAQEAIEGLTKNEFFKNSVFKN